MAQNPLVALLLAANLTTFDPTTITPNSSVHSIVMGVRVDIPKGRWWTSKPVNQITFPLLDVNSTVYISHQSLVDAQATVKAPNNTYRFFSGHLFSSVGPKMCDLSGISSSTFAAAFEQYYDKGPMRTSKLLGSDNVTSSLASSLNPATLTDIVFRPFSGCFEFVGLQCNFDQDVNPSKSNATFKAAFSRDEFSALNPSSGIDHCSKGVEYHTDFTSYPSWENKDNAFNVAFKIPTKLWEHRTVQEDAALFYQFTGSPGSTDKTQKSAAHQVSAIIAVVFAMMLSLLN